MGQKRQFELTLPPRNSKAHSYQWLRDALRSSILEGSLRAGQRIPSTRELACQYSLARGTILAAIGDLKAEGYLHAISGSGTFVCRTPPDQLLQSRHSSHHLKAAQPITRFSRSDFAKRVQVYSHYAELSSRAFRTNLPAVDQFPTTLWAKVVARRLQLVTSQQLLHCQPQGYEPLRVAIAEYLGISRGVHCSADQVLIVSGIQEALDLVGRLLINPGDPVLIEDPGYQVAHKIFVAAGAKLVPMPIDAIGAAPRHQDFRAARLIYLTPAHQFPLGITMPVTRRFDILRHAREAGTYIFEDDYESEYRYSGSPLPALQGLDRSGSVILAGSFNKTLFPSLRMGYMVLPLELVEIFTRTKALVNRHHSALDQAVVCDFIEQGHFGRHLRRMRKLYSERLSALSFHVERHLSDFVELSKVEAGLQTVGWLSQGLSAEAVATAAATRKVDVVPLSRYTNKLSVAEGLQIGFAAVDERSIEIGVKNLLKAFESLHR